MSNKEREFKENEIFISYTDPKGILTYGNDVFVRISGYTESELIGQPHNIIRHDDMPRLIFKLLWNFISSGKVISAYVKNRAKDGSYYWVLATVYAVYNASNEIESYVSIRIKPTTPHFELLEGVYADLLECEKEAGENWEEECMALFVKTLDSLGISTYEELMQTVLNDEFKAKEEYLHQAIGKNIDNTSTRSCLKDVYNVSEVLYNNTKELSNHIDELGSASKIMIESTKNITYSLSDTTLSAQNSAIMSSKLGELGRAFATISQYIQTLSVDGKLLSDTIGENVYKINNYFVVQEQLFVRVTVIKMALVIMKSELVNYLSGKSKSLRTVVDAKDFLSFNMNASAIEPILKEIKLVLKKMNKFAIELKALSSFGKIECTRIGNNSFNSVLATLDEVVEGLNLSSNKINNSFLQTHTSLNVTINIFDEMLTYGNVISLNVMAYQHSLFVDNVNNLVAKKEYVTLPTHYTCAFGKFYYGELVYTVEKLYNSDATECYRNIEVHHKAVHDLGQSALSIAHEGDSEKLEETLKKLEYEKREVMQSITVLIGYIKNS
ncbi:MAG: PAS domain-containing protein [Helicobacteraceae bacterium]|nr:PAS domain-containing protein [Helicobacteraceae bacterium]